jgi:hypothetical protein
MKCIGDPNQRKLFCENDLTLTRESPDADRLYPRLVRFCTRRRPRSCGRIRWGQHHVGCGRVRVLSRLQSHVAQSLGETYGLATPRHGGRRAVVGRCDPCSRDNNWLGAFMLAQGARCASSEHPTFHRAFDTKDATLVRSDLGLADPMFSSASPAGSTPQAQMAAINAMRRPIIKLVTPATP